MSVSKDPILLRVCGGLKIAQSNFESFSFCTSPECVGFVHEWSTSSLIRENSIGRIFKNEELVPNLRVFIHDQKTPLLWSVPVLNTLFASGSAHHAFMNLNYIVCSTLGVYDFKQNQGERELTFKGVLALIAPSN